MATSATAEAVALHADADTLVAMQNTMASLVHLDGAAIISLAARMNVNLPAGGVHAVEECMRLLNDLAHGGLS